MTGTVPRMVKIMSDEAASLREPPHPCVPNVGDWGVWRTSWDFEVEGPITGITPKQVRLIRWKGETRKDAAGLVFTGTEQLCRDLLSMLTASRIKRDAEKRAVQDAHEQRIVKAVAHVSARKDLATMPGEVKKPFPRIVAVAANVGTVIVSAPDPARHGEVLTGLRYLGVTTVVQPREQGFLTAEGHFVGRREAADIALLSGQIERLKWPPELYSEDLW